MKRRRIVTLISQPIQDLSLAVWFTRQGNTILATERKTMNRDNITGPRLEMHLRSENCRIEVSPGPKNSSFSVWEVFRPRQLSDLSI